MSVNFHCKCWKEGWYIFIFLDGCALFPQYCRWTKTTASRQVNIELPESAVCSRQGLQQFITERQYKARPVWLQLVNYNKSLGVFCLYSWLQGTGGLAFHKHSALCYTTACFRTLRAFCLAHTSTDRDLASKAYSKLSVDTKSILLSACRSRNVRASIIMKLHAQE